ncbi:MAG: PfkB family carbohydrate kinase [Thaumarchaeota archaeon]|nr:PfkB family carbohydrate kinase [Nitrososphaerota archaeon]MDD9843642.1 PfkB family carbohydrate kinase [Nitrososphaerota archaeon]RNJ72213.1 MAG: sugar kinase [Thaumarchaeota archaeon S13]RNJ72322.1 MAG: sugar kinase [Thaumarchaeota archaeon S14]RNJ75335.1 MAG: sugar kinase [Thaumarchaeota archaeon S15]
MLAVFGSVSLDTIRTPGRVNAGILGGSAAYAAVAASRFAKTGLLGVTGSDFPARYERELARHVDLDGVERREGRTFRYDAEYDRHLESRTTRSVELGVNSGRRVRVPEGYRRSRFVYLATNDPAHNIGVLGDFDSPRLSMCDTIDHWIRTRRADVVRMVRRTDAVVINAEEARLLTREHDLIRCAKKMASWGATYVIIKKDAHGALLYHGGEVYPYPAFPTGRVVDPTGAGDSFAGAVMGYLASRGSTGLAAMRRAVAYGNVVGSITVEARGLRSLSGLARRDIEARMRRYGRLTRF